MRLPGRLVKPGQVVRGRELLRTRKGAAPCSSAESPWRCRLPYRMFLLINVLWVAEPAVVGYLGGKRSKAAEHQLSLISLWLLAAIIAVFADHRVRNSARLQGGYAGTSDGCINSDTR